MRPSIELLNQAAQKQPKARIPQMRLGQSFFSQKALAMKNAALGALDLLDPNPFRPRGTPPRRHHGHLRSVFARPSLRRARDLG